MFATSISDGSRLKYANFLSKTDVILVSNSFAVEECLPNFANFPKTL